MGIVICPDGGMVDTKDLKSFGHNGCGGSSPPPGTATFEAFGEGGLKKSECECESEHTRLFFLKTHYYIHTLLSFDSSCLQRSQLPSSGFSQR